MSLKTVYWKFLNFQMVQHCLLELTDKEDEEDRKQLGKKLVEDIEF